MHLKSIRHNDAVCTATVAEDHASLTRHIYKAVYGSYILDRITNYRTTAHVYTYSCISYESRLVRLVVC